MRFLRGFNTETSIAIFAASIFIFFFASSAISLVQANTARADVPNGPNETISDNPFTVLDTDPDNPPSDVIVSPSPPPTDSLETDDPAAAGPRDPFDDGRRDWWDVISDFFSNLLAALSFA